MAAMDNLVENYFKHLINSFFKILPMFEDKEPTLNTYLDNLYEEMTSCTKIIEQIEEDPQYMSLLLTLIFLRRHNESGDLTHEKCKAKVFGAMTTCGRLSIRYSGGLDNHE